MGAHAGSRVVAAARVAGAALPGALLACLLQAGSAAAQDPVPPDSAQPADTVFIEPGDDLPDGPPAPDPDSLRIATMPAVPAPADTGWVEGEVRWDRDALLSSTASTLDDLLARVAGLHVIRYGYIGAPEAMTTAAGVGGAVEVYWDGMRLDPLGASTPDLGRIELASLESVRVSRGLDVVRVYLTTRVADDARPYTRVEAATADLDTEMFTGVALLPKVFWGPLGLGVTRVETDGRGGVEGAVALNAFAHWGITRERWGVRIQGRVDDLRRSANHPLVGDSRRVDVQALVTATLAPGVVAEVFGGRSHFDADPPVDTLAEDGGDEDTDPEADLALALVPADTFVLADTGTRPQVGAGYQAGLRIGAARGPGHLLGELRWRDEGPLPSLELNGRGSATFLDRVFVGAGVSHDRWSDGPDGATSWDARAALRLVGGLQATGAVGGGTVGIPYAVADTADSSFVALSSPRRTRVGARLTLGPLRLGAARVTARADTVITLGLGFDPRGVPLAGTDVTGWEVDGRLSAGSWPFRLEGWLEDWAEGATGPYVPVRSWRAGLVYDHLPLESENLHIYAGLFHSRRGSTLFPVPHVPIVDEVDPPLVDLVEVAPVQTLDFLLNVRVVRVRIFLRWENIALEDGEVFPGRPLLRQRVITGLRWDFFN